ncbi:MAG: exodeoxyribonuclease V subunit alpha [Candidatus Binatales bacterium]
MSDHGELLGVDTAWRRFEAASGARSHGWLETRLRGIESRADGVNLAPGCVQLAAEIAALEPDLRDGQRLALILLALVSLAALGEGSTRFPVSGPEAREPMRRMLGALCGEAEVDAMAVAIEELLESGAARGIVGREARDYKPLLYLAPFIYQQRIHSAEAALASRLTALTGRKMSPAIDEGTLRASLSDVLARPSTVGGKALTLSGEQCEAVIAAVGSPFAVISGGPGTGKTSIALAILRVLIRLGLAPQKIALAAPTGKAANRMGECIREGLSQIANRSTTDNALMADCPAPSTIHRLLDYSPSLGRFRNHRNNPLAASVVIVDEGSMLDLTLMERLLDAISPDAQLTILGDADQLPSVAAGAVFRDLTSTMEDSRSRDPGAVASVRLSQVYRFDQASPPGRTISLLAQSINRGVADVMAVRGDNGMPAVTRRVSAVEIAFAGAEYLGKSAGATSEFVEQDVLQDLLDRWRAEQVRGDEETRELAARTYSISENGFEQAERDRLKRLFTWRAASRILCVTRVFETGADRINQRLHRAAAGEAGASRDGFNPGEPVMVLRNDYERMLFNGDQGIAVRVRPPEGRPLMMAVFPRGDDFVAFRLDAMRDDLELCYAMTVHKAQGSEFDTVALILPATDIPILTREIVYTAVSRARKSMTIVGDEEILRLGISRKAERYSGLSEQIAALTA